MQPSFQTSTSLSRLHDSILDSLILEGKYIYVYRQPEIAYQPLVLFFAALSCSIVIYYRSEVQKLIFTLAGMHIWVHWRRVLTCYIFAPARSYRILGLIPCLLSRC
jgi:hypothetical protein